MVVQNAYKNITNNIFDTSNEKRRREKQFNHSFDSQPDSYHHIPNTHDIQCDILVTERLTRTGNEKNY